MYCVIVVIRWLVRGDGQWGIEKDLAAENAVDISYQSSNYFLFLLVSVNHTLTELYDYLEISGLHWLSYTRSVIH